MRNSQGRRPTRLEMVERFEWVARQFDTAFVIPGTQIRLGWDALLGLIPVLGDLIGLVVGFYAFYLALVLRLPWRDQAQILFNILFDWLLGLVPVLGDIADVAWKANIRNARLLRRAVERQEKQQDRIVGSANSSDHSS